MLQSFLVAKSLAETKDMLQVVYLQQVIQEHNATMYNF